MTDAPGRDWRPLGERLSGSRSEGGLEGRGRHVLEFETEDVAVGAEALKGPGQEGLDGYADRATGRNDAKQDTGAVGPLGAAGEEHIET